MSWGPYWCWYLTAGVGLLLFAAAGMCGGIKQKKHKHRHDHPPARVMDNHRENITGHRHQESRSRITRGKGAIHHPVEMIIMMGEGGARHLVHETLTVPRHQENAGLHPEITITIEAL